MKIDDLTSVAGLIGLIGVAIAVAALMVAVVALRSSRRVRTAQSVVLGTDGTRNLVEHSQELDRSHRKTRTELDELRRIFDDKARQFGVLLNESVSNARVVRYDAYGEMSGQQSSSLALLDRNGSGLVLSSIHHRDQARVYVKQVRGGRPEIDLSPEEQAAVDEALGASATVSLT